MIDTVNSSYSETHGFSLCHSKFIVVDKFVKINKRSDSEQSVSCYPAYLWFNLIL